MKVLLATQKPFAAKAVEGIVKILVEAGHEVVKLEKYAEQADFVAAVADVDAIIIRSDKVTAEVIAAAPKLKIVVRAGAGYDNVDLAAATAAGVVVMNETLKWIKSVGGVEAIYEINKAKAQLLYDEIDRNSMFIGTAVKEDRSLMNVCFVMAPGKEDLQDEFFAFAKERGMVGIKGHRSVGGFRASLYNACSLEDVQALVDCMKEFEALKK